ncbi:DMT family transporter [Vibrio sp. McD22-P3]|uniref:DMT family transporter n=1 Tax=Vibrio sp. McD22-P3 TaxID=2724880 RepID=UPI001F185BCC|nr:DMT family transporter [Vibrio sp. McD22-P3]MCF4176481.1 DMT family transporter [Vibrio sp. McD22-P3]
MNVTSVVLVILSVVVGVGLVSQAGVNAQLKIGMSSSLQAAFVSFVVGTAVLGMLVVIEGKPWFPQGSISSLPWWAWVGGLLGAFNIAMSIYLAPQLGALALAISIVCGQVIASIFYDQYGLLGYPTIEMTPQRIGGALLIILGVMLVTYQPNKSG